MSRSAKRRLVCLLVFIAALALAARFVRAAALRPPEAVSPGAVERALTARDGCPTFSWSQVPEARAFELTVHEIDGNEESPALYRRLPATLSWTPALEECLPEGRYAWLVRAETAQGWTAWSEPRLFQVTAPLDEPPAPDERRRSRTAGASADGGTAVPTPFRSSTVTAARGSEPRQPEVATQPMSAPPADCLAGQEVFSDVSASHPFCAWIQQIYRDAILTGCGSGPLRFCPDNPVSRGQLAVALERVVQARSTRQLDAGLNHTCAVLASGRMVCWGDNTDGKAPPGPSAELFRSVSAGTTYTCGVRVDGKVVCWGDNTNNQAPPGPSVDTFQSVATGFFDSCGVRSDGKMVCWGINLSGQAPPGPSTDTFTGISMAFRHTCAVRTDGKLLCWGQDDGAAPPPGPSVESFQSVSVGNSYTCAVRTDGQLMCWGGSAGTVPTGTFQSVSVSIQGHACAVQTDGKVVCWNDNTYNEAPPGPSADTFQSVSAGVDHTCGIRGSGAVECWGRSDNFLQSVPPPWL